MAPGDKWYLCRITESLLCRGVEQASWHLICHRNPPLKMNAGLYDPNTQFQHWLRPYASAAPSPAGPQSQASDQNADGEPGSQSDQDPAHDVIREVRGDAQHEVDDQPHVAEEQRPEDAPAEYPPAKHGAS